MKRIFWSILLAALFVSACTSTGAAPTVVDTTTPEPTATEAVTREPGLVEAGAGCTVTSVQPTPNPTLEALFPPATEDDWTRGPLTASVVIMEYSDFQ